jgi:hypothetical protein
MTRGLSLEYGSENDKQCSEICMPSAVVSFLPGAEESTCKHRGFSLFVKDTSVTQMGQAVAVKVFAIRPVKRKAVAATVGTCFDSLHLPVFRFPIYLAVY